MHLTAGASASSGWLPASVVALAAAVVVAAYGVPIQQVAIFGAYVAFGIALPGMLWVRLLRGRSAHIAEDLCLGLCAGYCLEIASYLVARTVGAPQLVVLWPVLTLVAFIAVPALRRHWRGGGTHAPTWWSWSIAAILGFLLIHSAGTVFAGHHLTGTDVPYVDMPYHLALIGELRHHLPPFVPYVTGVPLGYHWFFYAEAAATSWATGIEPVVLLYRLSGLPMFLAFVVLTAMSARRITGGWWTGPIAVAVALFGTVAGPYAWAVSPVFDTQTLYATWISPTNLIGLALLAAIVLVSIDLLHEESNVPRRRWLLLTLLIFGAAGAKASILPLLIVGFLAVVAGVAIFGRRLHRVALVGLAVAGVALLLATILIFRGDTAGLVIGLDALRAFPVVARPGAGNAQGLSQVIMPIAALLVALVLWSFLWAGAYGLIARRQGTWADPRILFLLGICAAALGAVSVFSYGGLSQTYYVKGAAGAFGVLAAAGIAAVLPARTRYLPLVACATAAALLGTATVLAIGALGPSRIPRLGTAHLSGVLPAIILPIVALLAAAAIAYIVLRRAEPKRLVLQGAVPLLVIAFVMGFSLPNVAKLVIAPIGAATSDAAVPGDGIDAARWLRDHSQPGDLVATNLHCRPLPNQSEACDARHFWVSAHSERRMLVEGWGYTPKAGAIAKALGVSDRTIPFWDQPLFAENEGAFSDPSPALLAGLREKHGVRWLFADLTMADEAGLGREADLRYRNGDFAVYALR